MTNINKLYIPLVIALFVLSFLLNLAPTVHKCAIIAVMLCLTTNIITSISGRTRAIQSIIWCSLVGLCILWNYNYYIHGRLMHGIVIASFLSITISTYLSSSVFSKFKESQGFNVGNLISLVTFSIVDCLCMSLFFITKYNFTTVLSIFAKEVVFRLVCVCAIFSALYLIGALAKTVRNAAHK